MHIWSGLSRKMDLNRDMRLSQVLFCRQWQWGLYAKEVASVGPTISFSFLLYYVTQDSTLKHPLVSQWKPRISQGLHMFGSTPSHSSHSHGSCGGGVRRLKDRNTAPLSFIGKTIDTHLPTAFKTQSTVSSWFRHFTPLLYKSSWCPYHGALSSFRFSACTKDAQTFKWPSGKIEKRWGARYIIQYRV